MKKFLFLFLLISSICFAQDFDAEVVLDQASDIQTNTTNFNNKLSITDTNVQKALDTIDNFDFAPSAHNLLSSYHSDTTPGSVLRGDLIVGQGVSPKWTRMALGLSGYYIRSDGIDALWSAIQDLDLPNTIVRISRNINTTSPLQGGGNLSQDRTFSLAGLSSLGTANYLVGVNSLATAWEYKNIVGTASEIDIIHSIGQVQIGLVNPLAVTKGGTGTGTQFTPGSVLFAGASGVYTQDNSNFFWDNTGKKLGIGNNSPGEKLEITGILLLSNNADRIIYIKAETGAIQGRSLYIHAGNNDDNCAVDCYPPGNLLLYGGLNTADVQSDGDLLLQYDGVSPTTGDVGIGTYPINKLDVEGALAVGASYSGAYQAPTNGAIIEGNVGITTTVVNNTISFSGNAARSVGSERHTTANTAGNNLTTKAGGATLGATDKNGGDLVFSSGIATGNGESKILFQTVDTSQGAGTTDRNPATRLQIDDGGHLESLGPIPSVSSCGTTPSIVGTDCAGKVTVGTGATTSCTITFAKAYTNAPACIAQGASGGVAYTGTTSTTAFTFNSYLDMQGLVVSYICIGRE